MSKWQFEKAQFHLIYFDINVVQYHVINLLTFKHQTWFTAQQDDLKIIE